MPPKRPQRKGQHDKQRNFSGQKPQSGQGQQTGGAPKPGQGIKPQPAAPTPAQARPPATNQPAPPPAPAVPPPEPPPPEATITTERVQPREEQVSMQTASSSTVTHPTHHHKVRSIHYTLSYALEGEEHGHNGAIVLLHGLPGDSFSWRHIMPALADQRAVYAFDMLSYGKSDHPWPADVSIWGQADVLAPCLRTLNLSNIVLVGYDVGGGVAQVLATRMAAERVKAIVLISTTCYAQAFAPNWPLPDMHKSQEPEAPHHTTEEQLIEEFTATFPKGAVDPKIITHNLMEHYLAPWKGEVGKENLFQHIRKQVPNYSMSVASDMKWVNKPVLIVWGEKDEVLSPSYAERLHRDIPGSQLALLPNTGHLVLEEAPDAVANAIGTFVSKL